MQSICYYTEHTDRSAEYGIRDDGGVFVRTGYFAPQFGWRKTKWAPVPQEIADKFVGLPKAVSITEEGSHERVPSARMRLPQP